jgi:hypothetical protein
MVKVEVQAHSGRRADHAVSVQYNQLPVFKQLHVLQEVHPLEALLLGKRRETDALQFFKLRGVLRASLSDHNPISQLPVVPPHRLLNLSQIWLESIL